MTVQIKYFGEPKVYIDNNEVSFPFSKSEALFYYMLITKKVSREKLIDLLWPSTSERSGRHNLRNAIYTLRQMFGQDLFDKSQRIHLELSNDFDYQSDYEQWQEGKGEALQLYQGCFLDGFSVKKAEGFSDWVLEVRRNAQAVFQGQLKKHMTLAWQEEAYRDLTEMAEQYIRCDEFDEWAWRMLMLGYKGQNKFKQAIDAYRDLEQLFEMEMSIEPDEKTQKVYRSLLLKRRTDKQGPFEDTEKLFAREREQMMIESTMDQFLAGQKALSYLITGETGIGKTVLVQKLIEKGNASEGVSIDCCCYHPDANTLMKVWYVIIEKLMKAAHKVGIPLPEETVHYLKGYFPGLMVHEEQLVAESIPIAVQSESSLTMCIWELFKCLGSKFKILLFIDDIQWADHLSLRMLKEIMELGDNKTLMVVATCREGMDDLRKDFRHELGRHGILHQLSLKRLDFDETKEFVRKQLSESAVNESLVTRIYQETEGNFLFLAEYINLLQLNADSFMMTAKIKDILYNRLSDLSEDAQKVLNMIAVFFDYADLIAIQRISVLEEENLIDALDELCNKALIRESINAFNEIRFAFNHQKIRDFVYNQLSSVKKRLLHGRVADVLIKGIQQVGYDRYAYSRLIYHLERSGNDKEVFHYRMIILKDYLDISHEVFPVLEEGQKRLVSLLTLDEAKKEFAYMNRSIKRLKEIHPGDIGLVDFELKLLHMEGRYHIQIGESDHGIQCIEQMIELADDYHRQEMKLEGLVQWTFYAINTYNTELMAEKLKEAETLNQVLKNSEKEAILLRLYGCKLVLDGQYEQAEENLNRSIEHFNRLTPTAKYAISIAASLNYLGDIRLYQGKWHEALQFHQEALEKCQEKGILSGSAVCLVKLGIASYENGTYKNAVTYFNQAEELYGKSNMVWLRQVLWGYQKLLTYRMHKDPALLSELTDKTVIQKFEEWRINPLVERLLVHISGLQ